MLGFGVIEKKIQFEFLESLEQKEDNLLRSYGIRVLGGERKSKVKDEEGEEGRKRV